MEYIEENCKKREEERNTRLCDTFIMKYYLRIAMKATEFMPLTAFYLIFIFVHF